MSEKKYDNPWHKRYDKLLDILQKNFGSSTVIDILEDLELELKKQSKEV